VVEAVKQSYVVGEKLIEAPPLAPGDRAIAIPELGELIVVPKAAADVAHDAVLAAASAFKALGRASDAAIRAFFLEFAARLTDPVSLQPIRAANEADVTSARERGRAVGRLTLSDSMLAAMVDGLKVWASTPSRVGELIEKRVGENFRIERRRAPLGVVAFVFEGRPNVFADAAGVLTNRNTAVFRIGADALRTAIAIEEHALGPALRKNGLPESALSLVRSKEHAAAHALFTERTVRLAVARGSGRTVALLGAIARQHGIAASLHGTGGAWMFVEASASPTAVENAIVSSLDRKVCNTLNVLVLERAAVATLGPVVERAFKARDARVFVAQGSEGVVSGERVIERSELAHEWEWDQRPEVSFVVSDGFADAVAMINRYSPHFVASILSRRAEAFEEFYDAVDAPYVSNAFTRWVDGQWAWQRPELGLTNWEQGRLFGRSGFLSGDDLTSVRDVFIDESGDALQRR
jgi:glutamate-5-semialdehyde dehydrogenase